MDIFEKTRQGFYRNQVAEGFEWWELGSGTARRLIEGDDKIEVIGGQAYVPTTARKEWDDEQKKEVLPEDFVLTNPTPLADGSWRGFRRASDNKTTHPEDQGIIKAMEMWRRTHMDRGEMRPVPDGVYSLGEELELSTLGKQRGPTLVSTLDLEVEPPRNFSDLYDYMREENIDVLVFSHPTGAEGEVRLSSFDPEGPNEPASIEV